MSGATTLFESALTSFIVRNVKRLDAGRGTAEAAAAGLDREQVRAEALDLLLHRRGGAAADGDEDDHRGDADRDAEQRQQRAQPVRQHSLNRHPQGLEQAHAVHRGPASSRAAAGRRVERRLANVGDDLAVGELDHAFGAVGDVVLVGDHHDRPAERRSAGRRCRAPPASTRCRGCRSARRRARSPGS